MIALQQRARDFLNVTSHPQPYRATLIILSQSERSIQAREESSCRHTKLPSDKTMADSKGIVKTVEPFVTGGAAATFASIVIHPIDLAKVSFSARKRNCEAGVSSSLAIVSQ